MCGFVLVSQSPLTVVTSLVMQSRVLPSATAFARVTRSTGVPPPPPGGPPNLGFGHLTPRVIGGRLLLYGAISSASYFLIPWGRMWDATIGGMVKSLREDAAAARATVAARQAAAPAAAIVVAPAPVTVSIASSAPLVSAPTPIISAAPSAPPAIVPPLPPDVPSLARALAAEASVPAAALPTLAPQRRTWVQWIYGSPPTPPPTLA